jgi:hypothetical protein
MLCYHGTNFENKKSIINNGFITNFGRFGQAAYFTQDIKEALCFGSAIIKVEILEENMIVENYRKLANIFPDIHIDEEEGIPELREYVLNTLKASAIVLSYDDGTEELCVYDTSLITIIEEQ